MKSLMFLVADYASVDMATGKLNVLGAFKSIIAPTFPMKHHALSLALKIGGELGELSAPHELTIELTDSDGKKLLGFASTITGPPNMQTEKNIVLEIRDIVFPHPGGYAFQAKIDGEDIGQTDIYLHLKPEDR